MRQKSLQMIGKIIENNKLISNAEIDEMEIQYGFSKYSTSSETPCLTWDENESDDEECVKKPYYCGLVN